jgi:predicted AlkP superfamily phosphohydrolase/phosphomutase/Tfp pilus assembly protein PilF
MKRPWLAALILAGPAVAGALGLLYVRRTRRPPATPSGGGTVPAVARSAQGGRPVLFVGLDGADWALLDRYLAAGSMPNLARLVREGAAGSLTTIHPPLSPLVWTTMMTGVSPVQHGILDFTRWSPAGDRHKEPITSDERRVPAVWNMAGYGGKRVAVFGLWATYPAETVSGLMVSDRLFSFLYKEDAPPPGAVYPAGQEAPAREALARAEKAVDYEALKAYLPSLTPQEYQAGLDAAEPYAHPVSALRRILVETRVYHELGRDWVQRERPDLTILYLQGTDTIGHVFAPYAPPRQPAVSEQDYERYHRVPERYFREVDAQLGEYAELAAASGMVLMLASDHGFQWAEGRPVELSSFAHATAAKWHRQDGIYLLWGPGIAAAPGHPHAGRVPQVCSTLLALLGLPPMKQGEPPLTGVAASPSAPVDYAAQYRPAAPARAAGAGRADAEAVEKLRALGYVGGGGSESAPRSSSTRTAGSYNNEGLILRGQDKPAEAREAFEKALVLDPDLASALWNLSDLLFTDKRDLDRSDVLLVRAVGHGLPEGSKYLVGRAIGYQRAGDSERSLRLVTEAAQAAPGEPDFWLFKGRYRVERRDCAGALEDFRTAVRLAPANAAAHAAQGLAQVCLGDREGARRSFQRSLGLDPQQPRVREYLAHL